MTTNKFIKFLVLPILLMAGFFVFGQSAQAAQPIDATDLGIWHFNENSGVTIYDATSNHNDLRWYYNLYAGGQKMPDRVIGKWDLAVNFKQNAEDISKSFSPAISWNTGLTIGIWIKSDLASSDYAKILWLGNRTTRCGKWN